MEEKYRRPDIEGGYIYDKNDIEYYRATQRNDVIDNGLLGDYNMVGAYVVNNAIVEELLKIRKIYTDSFGKSIFCESLKLFDGEPIKFRLNINSGVPTHTKITASLELMEDVKRVNGFYTNTNTVLLISKVYDDKKDVNKKIFKDFNISQINRDESGAKVENNFEVRNIILRLNNLKDLQESATITNTKLERMLFEKRMKVLLSSKNSASLIEEFNRQVFHSQGKFLNKSNKNYYRHVNQVLDSVLQMRGFELTDESVWKKLKEIGLEYSKELNKNLDQVYSNQKRLEEIRHTQDFKKVEDKMLKTSVKETPAKEKAPEQSPKQDSKEVASSVPTSTPKVKDFAMPKTPKTVKAEPATNNKRIKEKNVDSLLNSAQGVEKEAVNSLLKEVSTQFVSEEDEREF